MGSRRRDDDSDVVDDDSSEDGVRQLPALRDLGNFSENLPRILVDAARRAERSFIRDIDDIQRDEVDDQSGSSSSDSAEDGDEENVEGADPEQGGEEYDPELPNRHTYLGETRELTGRTLLDEDKIVEIPIWPKTGMVVMPGQTIPMTFFRNCEMHMIKMLVITHRTFGIVNRKITSPDQIETSDVGTTCEIFEFQEPRPVNDFVNGYSIKAKGRQRFKIVTHRRTLDGVIMGKIKVLPEVLLPDPMYEIRLISRDRLRPIRPEEAEDDEFESDSDDDDDPSPSTISCVTPGVLRRVVRKITSPGASYLEKMRQKRDNKKEFTPKVKCYKLTEYNHLRTSVYGPPITHLPNWVFEMYDPQILVEKVHIILRSLKLFSKTQVSIPEDPTELSFWVASNLPFEEGHRLELLKIDCTVRRLRMEISLLEKISLLCCINCGETIAKQSDIFSMSKEGPQGAFVNTGGYVHETLTLYKVKHSYCTGNPETHFSWFPGYAWEMLSCKNCRGHLGWRFTADPNHPGKLHPKKFYGLTRKSVQPKITKDDDTEEAI